MNIIFCMHNFIIALEFIFCDVIELCNAALLLCGKVLFQHLKHSSQAFKDISIFHHMLALKYLATIINILLSVLRYSSVPALYEFIT